MLRGRGDGGSRKPRLFVDSSDSKADEESKNPIAAALAARKRKQGIKVAISSYLHTKGIPEKSSQLS